MTHEQIMDGLRRADMRVQAATLVAEGARNDYLAALRVGTPAERQNKADASMAAHEAVLDSYAVHMWWLLKINGIDPETREMV